MDVEEVSSEWLSGVVTRGGSKNKALLWIFLGMLEEQRKINSNLWDIVYKLDGV